jgi:hypothetical protein
LNHTWCGLGNIKGNDFVTCGRIGVEGGSLMLSLDIPKTVGSLRSAGVSTKSASVNDVRELQRRLKRLDPSFRKALLREAKKPAKPVQAAIKNRLASVTPPSGMQRGRLNWNASTDAKGRVHPPTDVKIEFRTKSSGSRLFTSLVRVRAASPAVAMADMAGRSGRSIDAGYKGTGRTRSYKWKNTERMHRVNGQGRALIRALGGKASRYVYPAAESSLPQAMREVDKVVKDFASLVNMKGF